MAADKVAVLGAGSWGTALAKLVADQGRPVSLWARRDEVARAIEEERENKSYLAGFRLPDSLTATSDLQAAVDHAVAVVVVVPSHGIRPVLAQLASALPEDCPVLGAIKGIENETLKLVSEVFEEVLPKERHEMLCYLGGPSFAREVAAEHPTVVCIAGRNEEVAHRFQQLLSTEAFRAYRTTDVVGVELGGALKNVIAIASGITDGLGFGHNTRAALITRGLFEMSRLASKLGADPLTMSGLGGMGDLVLTCTGDLSRNRQVGLRIGKGETLEQILGSMNMVAEGVRTAKSAHELAQRENVDMPIVAEIYRILYEGKDPRKAVQDLMTRPLKPERS